MTVHESYGWNSANPIHLFKESALPRFVCPANLLLQYGYQYLAALNLLLTREVNQDFSNEITYIGHNSRFKNIFRLAPFAPFHLIVGRVKNSPLACNCDINFLFLIVFSWNYD